MLPIERQNMSYFKLQSQQCRARVDPVLVEWISSQDCSEPLKDAMYYSVFNGGKRVRPILVYAAARACQASSMTLSPITDVVAAALECIHAYSLVHDDLPAMDDDDLRRGKPTCHIAFSEATAILTGDALQALAFEKLSLAGAEQPAVALSMLTCLAQASGASGMVAGQMLDLDAEGGGESITLDALQFIHRHKTGALIRAAVIMGARSANATEAQLSALEVYADKIGLAFQVQDDILDITSDTETLGKQQGSDIKNNKSTYVSLLGLGQAQLKANQLVEEAKYAIDDFETDTRLLLELADYIISRNT